LDDEAGKAPAGLSIHKLRRAAGASIGAVFCQQRQDLPKNAQRQDRQGFVPTFFMWMASLWKRYIINPYSQLFIARNHIASISTTMN
jgi:hypothetical protein